MPRDPRNNPDAAASAREITRALPDAARRPSAYGAARARSRRALALSIALAGVTVSAQSREAPSPTTLAALEAAAGGERVEYARAPTRTLCSSPREAWIRARVRPALPACDAADARLELRNVDRSYERLDVSWTESLNGGPERTRHRAFIVGEDELFALDDPRALDLARDAPRGPADAWRAALLLVAGDDCVPAFDAPPAGLGVAGERVGSGVRARDGGFHAVVWLSCPAAERDVPRARIYRLESVQTALGRSPTARTVARYGRGIRLIPTPPTR